VAIIGAIGAAFGARRKEKQIHDDPDNNFRSPRLD
jgi:hypothetical protein